MAMMERALIRAEEFVGGSHYCDIDRDHRGQHRHDACDCPCSVCFSFWHWNVPRYEAAKALLREAKKADG